MSRKISSGLAWLARGAAMLVVLSVVLVLLLVGALVMLAVLFGMLALPSRETPGPSGKPANSRRGRRQASFFHA